uniref:NAD(P)H-nitrite reductase n=1 Tax=candidate division WOR-3 bacterium TaxID=2052148 RepID=A0A7C4GC20_UNCW3
MSTGPDPTVCYCAQVTRSRIVAAIRDGATTLKQIQETTGAGLGDRCKELNPKGTCCIPDILAILEEETGTQQKGGCACPHCRPK